ncbi:hypothetical protein [Psychromonas sp. Urea-02u-13]|uniref:hypothetical protein n=1 Tax=Psychromonas sp. Urea-02u-13 TaxID=2058326 RepID=UPI000C34070F|nr:hypothetical protein [Psychromonas sp. Urea-02u-13]PKG37330.1 hypothetical protein CXF74_19370 [Psychromonas sp. Urea-02u-13]
MNKISEIRNKMLSSGIVSLDEDDFNQLQAEWVKRAQIEDYSADKYVDFDLVWLAFGDILTNRHTHSNFSFESIKNSLGISSAICSKIVKKACEECLISSVGNDEYCKGHTSK